MAGQVVAPQQVQENGSVNVAHLPIGVYAIVIENTGKVYTQKLVIK